MATRDHDGTFRIRRVTPGYGSGRLSLRLGIRDKRTAERWERLLLDAYQEGYFDIINALIARDIWFPEAIQLRSSGGWASVRRAIAAKQQSRSAGQYDAETLLARFVNINPKRARDKTMRTIESHVRSFIAWIKQHHHVSQVDVRQWFTQQTLREFRDHLIKSRHDETIARLEERWKKLGADAPSRAEQQQILERDKGAKSATGNRYVNSAGAFSSWLVSEGILDVSPAVGVRVTTRAENPTRERIYRYFTPERLRTFLEYARRYDAMHPAPPGQCTPDSLFWRFLVATGATTQNEGARFCIRHLSVDREADEMVPIYIHGTKSLHRPREVEIPASLAYELVQRAQALGINNDEPLFPFTYDQYLAVWRGVMRLIMRETPPEWQRIVRHKPYDLRHTYAVNALRAGLDLEQLRQLMGHASITTTQMYARHQQSPRAALRRMAARLGIA